MTSSSPRGVGLIGAEVAQLGHVDQLVVDHRGAPHHAVVQDHPGLGGAVTLHQMHVGQQGLDPRRHLSGDRRGTGQRHDKPSAEHVLPQLGLHLRFQRRSIGAVHQAAVDLAVELCEHHVPDARHEAQFCGPHQGEVLEQRRQVALGDEVGGTAVGKRPVEHLTAPDVAHRHEVQRDRGVTARLEPATRLAPEAHHLALAIHGAFGCAGTTRGVNQQRQRVVGAVGNGCGRQRPAAFDQFGKCVDGHRAGQPSSGGFDGLAVGVNLAVVIEYDQPGRGVTGQHFDGVAKIVDAGGDHRRLGLGDDRAQPGDRRTGLQWNRHGAQPDQRDVDGCVVDAVEAQHANPVARPDRGLSAQRGGQCAGAGPQFAVGDGLEPRQ